MQDEIIQLPPSENWWIELMNIISNLIASNTIMFSFSVFCILVLICSLKMKKG